MIIHTPDEEKQLKWLSTKCFGQKNGKTGTYLFLFLSRSHRSCMEPLSKKPKREDLDDRTETQECKDAMLVDHTHCNPPNEAVQPIELPLLHACHPMMLQDGDAKVIRNLAAMLCSSWCHKQAWYTEWLPQDQEIRAIILEKQKQCIIEHNHFLQGKELCDEHDRLKTKFATHEAQAQTHKVISKLEHNPIMTLCIVPHMTTSK